MDIIIIICEYTKILFEESLYSEFKCRSYILLKRIKTKILYLTFSVVEILEMAMNSTAYNSFSQLILATYVHIAIMTN